MMVSESTVAEAAIVRASPVEMLKTFTLAAGTAAPEGSRTTPMIEPAGV